MKTRREFLQVISTTAAASALMPAGATESATRTAPADFTPGDDRRYWIEMLQRIAEPVLTNLAENQLKARMPVESPANQTNDRHRVTHLEAFGRTLCGLAPWLELTEKSDAETKASQRLAQLARRSLANATDPAAPDFLNFTTDNQPLVDAAFLSQALLRAKTELWEKLDSAVKQRVVECLQKVRRVKPGLGNWLLFSAMVETFLASVGADWQETPIAFALHKHEEWYEGDGTYGDGPEFQWNYYNSFVIQPMMIDVLEHIRAVSRKWDSMQPVVLTRAKRYAAIQERLIASDGTYPPIGRSITYRCGAFQLLAQMALHDELPETVSPAQVRCALTAVIKKTLGGPGTFDDHGWLLVGLCGHQPGLAENYISTGSLYLCMTAFLPLGLPASHEFWATPAAMWTQQKLWSGMDLPADHALASMH